MGMKITNQTEVITMFRMVDKNVTREAREVMHRYADQIRDTARAFAPVLEHRIEKAIKVLPSQGNQYSLRLVIAVTGTVDGRSVDTYAAIVHEYPWSKRGVYTRLKGPQAGPRYLARAVEKHKKDLMVELRAAMSKGIGQSIARSGVNKNKRRR